MSDDIAKKLRKLLLLISLTSILQLAKFAEFDRSFVRHLTEGKVHGKFITVEGGEGTGKTSLVRALASSLTGEGVEVVRSREPGGTALADRIRGVFRNQPSNGSKAERILPQTELLLISAARAQHVQGVIAPALSAGKLVLCDRFADSTRVYQGKLGGLSSTVVENLIALTVFGLEPDLTILLTSEYSVVRERLAGRDGGDEVMRYDPTTEEDHYIIQNYFRELQKENEERITILDTTNLSVLEAVETALKILRRRFGAQEGVSYA